VDYNDLRALLSDDLLRTAEWRREKAQEFPDDRQRNEDAAKWAERLADQFRELDDEKMRSLSAAVGEYDLREAEVVSEYIRQIGFARLPRTAELMAYDLSMCLGSVSDNDAA
jgi:hypothetical protein